jgi:TonB family protein
MPMRFVVLVSLVASCGPGLRREPLKPKARDTLTSRDPAVFERLMRGGVVDGGLWFDDPNCIEFNTAGEVAEARRSAFARCLAALGLHASEREDALGDVVVMEYGPYEVEARVVAEHDGPRLTWIGFSARLDASDSLPTLSPEGLAALRVETPMPEKLEPDSTAWLKLCIDETGAVTAADVREMSSPAAATAYRDAVMRWKLRPFTVSGQPMPVCSMVHLANRQKAGPEVLPLPAPPSRSHIRPIVLTSGPHSLLEGRRISGQKLVVPDDETKTAIANAGGGRVTGSFRLCLDTTGQVESVMPLRSTGLASYDRDILRAMQQWRYSPYMIDGKPVPVCTSVTFIYTQR